MARLADVVVDRVADALDHPFTYGVPDELASDLQIGQLVFVPFGKTTVGGIVWRIYDAEAPNKVKPLGAIRRVQPVLTPVLRDMAEWMAERYLCYLSQAIRAMVPSSVRRDLSVRHTQVWYAVAKPRQGRSSHRQQIYEYIAESGVVDRRTLLDIYPAGGQALRDLVKEGVLAVSHRPPLKEPVAPHPLTNEQEQLVEEMASHWGRPWLLEGVTGSGKTEVYLSLIERALSQGQQALVLLPEIALTPQTVMRFRERFGALVRVWHSGLSQAERRDTWEAVQGQHSGVVIGARSAVFLPFPALGIIVVDEEHEPTYKQEEHPRYHTREVALWRGARQGATVVLGSATPSLESRFAAQQGRLYHALLPHRIFGRPLPPVELVDMREELRQGNRDIFSRILKDRLGHAIERDEQVILFLNRRGFSTFILCRSCGGALECPDCAVSLTYHQTEHTLSCHYCLKTFPVPSVCPHCGSDRIRYFGAGTEKVVSEVERLFPGTRVLRADRDTLTKAQDYALLYDEFYRGKAQVLVGTQMIAKGMDFPKVSLVGIVAADTALHLPDYRSAERSFQLLVQAGGRSGRGEIAGAVTVQTYSPDHYALRHAQHHDYASFYEEEIRFREMAHYPPYWNLWLLALDGPEEAEVAGRAHNIAQILRSIDDPGLEVLGPAPAPLARLKGRFRYHVLVKTLREEVWDARLRQVFRHALSEDPHLSVTRDPYFMI